MQHGYVWGQSLPWTQMFGLRFVAGEREGGEALNFLCFPLTICFWISVKMRRGAEDSR